MHKPRVKNVFTSGSFLQHPAFYHKVYHLTGLSYNGVTTYNQQCFHVCTVNLGLTSSCATSEGCAMDGRASHLAIYSLMVATCQRHQSTAQTASLEQMQQALVHLEGAVVVKSSTRYLHY